MPVLEVQNLIFVLPALLAVVYLMMLAFAGDFSGHDADVGTDIGAHIEVNADHHFPHAIESLSSIATFFLIGRVPVSVVLVSFLLIWGGTGAALNLLFAQTFVSVPVAGAAAIFGSRWLALAIYRLLPSDESYAVHREDLVGLEAVVTYRITPQSGEVRLIDKLGNQRDVPCRLGEGHADVEAGEKVLLVLYDTEQDAFIGRKI